MYVKIHKEIYANSGDEVKTGRSINSEKCSTPIDTVIQRDTATG